MTFTFHLKTWFKVTANPLPKSFVYVNDDPNRAKWRMYMIWKKGFFAYSDMILTYEHHLRSLHTLWQNAPWGKNEPYWTKGREDMLWTWIVHIILLWSSHLTLTLGLRSLHTLYSKALFMWSMSQKGLSWDYICYEKKIFCMVQYDLDPWSTNRSLHTLYPKAQVGEVWARLGQGERRYALNMDFSYNSAMT